MDECPRLSSHRPPTPTFGFCYPRVSRRRRYPYQRCQSKHATSFSPRDAPFSTPLPPSTPLESLLARWKAERMSVSNEGWYHENFIPPTSLGLQDDKRLIMENLHILSFNGSTAYDLTIFLSRLHAPKLRSVKIVRARDRLRSPSLPPDIPNIGQEQIREVTLEFYADHPTAVWDITPYLPLFPCITALEFKLRVVGIIQQVRRILKPHDCLSPLRRLEE